MKLSLNLNVWVDLKVPEVPSARDVGMCLPRNQEAMLDMATLADYFQRHCLGISRQAI